MQVLQEKNDPYWVGCGQEKNLKCLTDFYCLFGPEA